MIASGVNTRLSGVYFFEVPPRHDAYVDGDGRGELILFVPPEHQNRPVGHLGLMRTTAQYVHLREKTYGCDADTDHQRTRNAL